MKVRHDNVMFFFRAKIRMIGDNNRDNNSDDISDKICETISNAIAEGALRPGMKVLDDVIAKHFGVSRTVARGVLSILEREHVIERRRNHGAFVSTPDKIEAEHLLEARRMLELAIVERASRVASKQDLDQLYAMTKDEETIHSSGDSAAQKRLAGNFHIELAKAAGNLVLVDSLKNVVARLSLVAALYERQTAERCGADNHRQIIEALRSGDTKTAKDLMDDHLGDIEASLDLSSPADQQSSLSAILDKFAPKSK